MRLILASALICASLAWGQEVHKHHEVTAAGLGSVNFPISCSAAGQALFTRAVALLHSFGYEEARRAFDEVAAADSNCGIAYWGVAMTFYHPIWAPPTNEEVKQGAAAAERAYATPVRSAREKDLIAAIRSFYQDWQTVNHRTRATAYESAMEAVHERYPADDEVTIFYALAKLGNLDPADKSYAKQKDAARLLNAVLLKNANHPGVAHYLIHSYDYPELAELALPAARAYAKIAP